MGLILVLGIQYLVSLRNEDNRHAPGLEKHSRIGPILVILSLGFNILQLIFDLLRGWNVSSYVRLGFIASLLLVVSRGTVS